MKETYESLNTLMEDYFKESPLRDSFPIIKSNISKKTYFMPVHKHGEHWFGITISKYKNHSFHKESRMGTPCHKNFYWTVAPLSIIPENQWYLIHTIIMEIKGHFVKMQKKTISKQKTTPVQKEKNSTDFILPPTPVQDYREVKLEPSTNVYQYWDDLNTPQWQQKECTIFTRDKFTCTWCGDKTSRLTIFTLVWKNNIAPNQWPLSDLITLCEDCNDHGRLLKTNENFRPSPKIQVLKVDKDHAWIYDNSGTLYFSKLWVDGKGRIRGKATIMKNTTFQKFKEFILTL